MATVQFKGNDVQTNGQLPAVGSVAPDFVLVGSALQDIKLSDYKGKKIILNIFPSVDTGTCAASVRNFNKTASTLDNTLVLCISRDLPFAQKRFCGAEGLENVVMLSDFKTGQFGKEYGLEIVDGPLAGLSSRCVVVIDETGKIIYTEQVTETTEEPNYELALASL